MPTEISISAKDPSSTSRAFSWPVLEPGNGSYEDGQYSVTCEDKERGKSLSLVHRVYSAPLIERWMELERTNFVCSVAAPRSMYRKVHVSNTPEQTVEWVRDDLGEYPMFTPMIIAREEIHHVADCAPDGLNRIWHGKTFLLPKGGRIAVGATFKLQAGINGILDFNLDETLGPGRFRVDPSSEDGFKFKVRLATDLYEHLRYRRKDMAGVNIMVHVVSAALSYLQRQWPDDPEDEDGNWRSFRNLVGLADLLAQHNLGHWLDDHFSPELAATGLYPHRLPLEGGEE